MSLRCMLSACLIIGLAFATTENAFSQTPSDETSSTVTGITAGRARSIITAVAGLISLIIGWRAKTRPAGTGRSAAITALVLGVLCVIFSIVQLSTTTGGFGTGGGKAGAIVAFALGMTGIILSGMALRTKKE
ncbi:DUF6223 family protein [Chitinophaga niabensis]|uniref:DUF6223 family protein n=1 Tax=Chitinophaga niabensis TaxID=536979 RepID=UPI0031B9EDFF